MWKQKQITLWLAALLTLGLIGCAADVQTALSGPSSEIVLVPSAETDDQTAESDEGSMMDQPRSGGNMMDDNQMAGSGSMQGSAPEVGVDDDELDDEDEEGFEGDFDPGEAEQVLEIVLGVSEIAAALDTVDNYNYEIFIEDEGYPVIEFFIGDWEDWLGYAVVEESSGEVIDYFVVRELSPEEFQAGQEQVRQLVLNDAEVLATLVDPAQWEIYIEYDKYEAGWGAYFFNGLDEIGVFVTTYDGLYEINRIEDLTALEEADQRIADQNTAIWIAYEAPGFDDAIAAHEDWKAYASLDNGSVWTVTIAAEDLDLFYAVVDVSAESVLESGTP